MTQLDSALLAAQTSEEQQHYFYNTFLSIEFFIPTHDMSETDQDRRAEEDESISPIIIEFEGDKYLMLFDSKERLSAWAKREIGFVVLPGHAIVEMMTPEFHWALNLGTDYAKIFDPEEICWLKSILTQSKGQELEMAVGTTALVGAPAGIPNGLIDFLIRNIKRNPEIEKAYLGQIYFEKEDEIPHLALVIDVPELSQSKLNAIKTDLAIAARGYLNESKYIDIMLNDSSGLALEITKEVRPFYESK